MEFNPDITTPARATSGPATAKSVTRAICNNSIRT